MEAIVQEIVAALDAAVQHLAEMKVGQRKKMNDYAIRQLQQIAIAEVERHYGRKLSEMEANQVKVLILQKTHSVF